jgi:hypothetical protein
MKEALAKLVAEELAVAEKLVKGGVAKAQVYQELTKEGYWGLADDPSARHAAVTNSAQQSASQGPGSH